MVRYQASVTHASGSAILPSDFANRQDEVCQICAFLKHSEFSVIRRTSTQDIAAPPGWPNMPHVLIYGSAMIISNKGQDLPESSPAQRMLSAFFMSPLSRRKAYSSLIGMNLSAPGVSALWFHTSTRRGTYSPSHPAQPPVRASIQGCHDLVTQLPCHHCTALREIAAVRVEQSIGAPPDAVGVSFDADFIKRERERVLAPGECVTSLMATTHCVMLVSTSVFTYLL